MPFTFELVDKSDCEELKSTNLTNNILQLRPSELNRFRKCIFSIGKDSTFKSI
jgi:hypothetical protein